MKKLITILSAFALSLSLANAQQNGPGDGIHEMDGDGPHGPRGAMWDYISDAVAGDEVLEGALQTVTDIRAQLAQARIDNPDLTVEEFRTMHAEQIEDMREAISTLQNWWRENRPDRPGPVISGEMLQRRNQFKQNSQNIRQNRQQLRELQQSDPGNTQKMNTLREQLGTLLTERKNLLRDRRHGEGGPSGEGNPGRGG